MRTTTTTLAVPFVALLALAGVATTPVSAAQPRTEQAQPEQHRERGVVLECTGAGAHGSHTASVVLYENDRHGHDVTVVLDGDHDLVGHRRPADVLDHGVVSTSVRIQGHRARVDGTARRARRATPVHETYDDAGNHIEVDGTHRRLRTDLTLTYRGTSYPLTCRPAFAYDLQVRTTPTV